MSQIGFTFNGQKTIIQCDKNEKMKNICNRFSLKIGKEMNSLIFIYNGNSLDEDLKIQKKLIQI